MTTPLSSTAPVSAPASRKILLVDPSEKGALPLYTGMVAQGLEAAGAEPVVLGNAQMQDPQLEGRWPVIRALRAGPWPPPVGAAPPSAGIQARRWFDQAFTIWRTTRAMRPDVVHIQYPLHPRLDPWLVASLRPFARVVWTAHDVRPHDGGHNVEARARKLYRAADMVLVHSAPAREELLELSGVVAYQIRHPVRALAEPPSRHVARQRLGLSENDRVVSAVGFIRRYKGYELLLQTLRAAPAADLRLVILGELVDDSERDTIQALGQDPRVDLRLGYADERDLIDLIAASDAILLPHAAGSDSGSLHMARALRIPVIATDAPQIAAVVRSTGAGIVVPRIPERWAQALTSALPPPPPPPPSPTEIGAEHLALYEIALSQTAR